VRKFVRGYGGALVEEFITGREFTVLVVENPADPQRPQALVPVECSFSEGGWW
jgi:D-alanine-D-alanine ligase